jgi:hypothetical protein
VQLAYAVSDVRVAALRWTHRGAGPFFIREHIEVVDVTSDGEPVTFDHSSAYGQWGEMMIELVVLHAAPEVIRVHSTGLHHVAHIVPDFVTAADSMVAAGFPEVLRAHTASGRPFAFHDARHELGHFIEIYAHSDSLRVFYETVRVASRGWDGSHPVREL